ncbi:LysR family transcriptional regulator [Thaumasiovibrio sp. DFM-14]|uniref:LysR family transcriptional regulator n=1 Tax=Thaumasiovibrio sp. DFM-14 TaxID=3384792 RepID=UPI0039A278E9
MHTLDQLAAFVAVYESGSYSAAARALGKDRATIREQVLSFEDTLGYSLFVITGRKATPTEHGQALFHRAKVVVRQNQELANCGLHYFNQPRTKLTVCHDSLVSFDMIKFIESRCARYFPSLQLQWLHRNRKDSLDMLSTRKADILVMANRGAGEAEIPVHHLFLGSVALNCFVGEHSPLRQIARPSIQDLQLELQYISEHLIHLDPLFVHVSPKYHLVSNNDVLCELVTERGWAALPRHIAKPYIEQQRLFPLSVAQLANDVPRGISAFYQAGDDSEVVLGQILLWLREYGETHLQ